MIKNVRDKGWRTNLSVNDMVTFFFLFDIDFFDLFCFV